MKIKKSAYNGNSIDHRHNKNNINTSIDKTNYLFNNTQNITDNTESVIYENQFQNTTDFKDFFLQEDDQKIIDSLVCNEQYKLLVRDESESFKLNDNTAIDNLEPVPETCIIRRESLIGISNESCQATPVDEDRAFDLSDSEEMSDSALKLVPRGIVNPNYPGFQHLAHTLQDYSNIDSYYPSEYDMTDDDDITESCEIDTIIKQTDNNNDTKTIAISKDRDIPDLIKNISNNNTITLCDLNCTESDIENNFDTIDIIGDFNKEIEDEIKQLLNYNINIQQDLEELRKDIKDTFAKPIENTINNISEVVNHVIKKLVEIKQDENDENYSTISNNEINKLDIINTSNDIDMKVNRPTFLVLENNKNKIDDAFLSDAKDEINIVYDCEYDDEHLCNVENTIRQLSTELKKIIPQIEEMKELDKVWSEFSQDTKTETDTNFNQIPVTTKSTECILPNTSKHKPILVENSVKKRTPSQVSSKTTNHQSRVQHKENVSKNSRLAQTNTSVHKSDSGEDLDLGAFDVYNIETALPTLDFDAIEIHLKAAKEEERRKRNDREEIRKRLAMGADDDEYYSLDYNDRPGKKPSLHSRLQSGKNLQICFMNDTASDNESQASDIEKSTKIKSLSQTSIFSKSNYSLNNHPYQTKPLSISISKHEKMNLLQSASKLKPSLAQKPTKSKSTHSLSHIEMKESDFYLLQSTLQTEARIALAQAKEMARIQMERERRARPSSPVSEMLRAAMCKADAPLAPTRRRVSRQLLTDMNIAQLQVIVNDLHCRIEGLNESLVRFLMARDDLHMSQDSMLVDIEDLTRYFGVKEQTKKTKGSRSGVRRLTSFVQK